ncbi:MAG: BLUF domain-containing protein [Verrucomicrobia bacterium]|nr:BLUF domain-containing protein [Verrucomicrobiota bacterium]MCH8511393.1 BLUF domain-containing protein [Kiritimatiellia bacterium]
MDLVQLIYVSRLSPDCDAESLKEILDSSRKNNRKMGITGILCRDKRFFLQCLEGSRAAVNELYATIIGDKRHSDVIILCYREIVRREFGAWSMAFVSAKKVDKVLTLQYSSSTELDPYAMPGQASHDFLVDLANTWKGDLEG